MVCREVFFGVHISIGKWVQYKFEEINDIKVIKVTELHNEVVGQYMWEEILKATVNFSSTIKTNRTQAVSHDVSSGDSRCWWFIAYSPRT